MVGWAHGVNAADLYISVIVLQELEIGVLLEEQGDPPQGVVLRSWLNNHVLPAFSGRILPVDVAVAIRSAKLHVTNPRTVRDGLIAATALVHGMTFMTRNVADFLPCGLSLINPWNYDIDESES